MREHLYFVYILASRRNGTPYVGHDVINTAIAREKRLKRWNRAWKIKLIEENNSGWNDLYDGMMGEIALPDLPGSPSPRFARPGMTS
jgi:predicted GIY-YIG superfamily endonuclease